MLLMRCCFFPPHIMLSWQSFALRCALVTNISLVQKFTGQFNLLSWVQFLQKRDEKKGIMWETPDKPSTFLQSFPHLTAAFIAGITQPPPLHVFTNAHTPHVQVAEHTLSCIIFLYINCFIYFMNLTCCNSEIQHSMSHFSNCTQSCKRWNI